MVFYHTSRMFTILECECTYGTYGSYYDSKHKDGYVSSFIGRGIDTRSTKNPPKLSVRQLLKYQSFTIEIRVSASSHNDLCRKLLLDTNEFKF